ncbi:MAG: aldehyde dehydrogenase family protein [Candidatus Acinetobacter avistercoris]|uniref:aldehyde dehydrogenase family protein n=1 Tax=Acinetobacter sp. KS-LM10 TaxID=3120518 RepID=UPI001FA12979|nr:aldehyde dehydrogenase family protein [Candidatus Acinetobacter avistercoris]
MNAQDHYSLLNQQYINGRWREGSSSRQAENINPYTQKVLNSFQLASQQDVDTAYQSAKAAQSAWEKTAPSEKQALIKKLESIVQIRSEEIIDWIIQESGSTRIKATIELGAALGIIKEAETFPLRVNGEILPTSVPDQQSRIYRKALGVIGVISPWNFPFHLSMRSVITALAVGNTVVLKPASDTPVTGGTLLAKLFEEAGFPEGVLNVVVGAGSEIGDFFVEHAVPSLISFTGSTEIGKRVGQLAVGGKHIKRIALELGGNAPMVVLDDADLPYAVDLTVMGRFLHQGQICMSTNRVIVDAKVYDEFVDLLIKKVQTLAVGDPDIMGTLIGPIINSNQIKNIERIIEQAKASGAKLVLCGETQGNIIPPHVFVDVNPQSSLAREESFGPILPVIKARDEAHALELANDTEYGLSSAVCTTNHERGVQFALGIDAGMTHINDITVDDQPNAPFGGEKNSGLGRFNGHWIIDEFTRTHWVTVQTKPKAYPV